jgi:hypothetical protein
LEDLTVQLTDGAFYMTEHGKAVRVFRNENTGMFDAEFADGTKQSDIAGPLDHMNWQRIDRVEYNAHVTQPDQRVRRKPSLRKQRFSSIENDEDE